MLSENDKSLYEWASSNVFPNKNPKVKSCAKSFHPSNPLLSFWNQVSPRTCYPAVKCLQELCSLYHRRLRTLQSNAAVSDCLLHFCLKVSPIPTCWFFMSYSLPAGERSTQYQSLTSSRRLGKEYYLPMSPGRCHIVYDGGGY